MEITRSQPYFFTVNFCVPRLKAQPDGAAARGEQRREVRARHEPLAIAEPPSAGREIPAHSGAALESARIAWLSRRSSPSRRRIGRISALPTSGTRRYVKTGRPRPAPPVDEPSHGLDTPSHPVHGHPHPVDTGSHPVEVFCTRWAHACISRFGAEPAHAARCEMRVQRLNPMNEWAKPRMPDSLPRRGRADGFTNQPARPGRAVR